MISCLDGKDFKQRTHDGYLSAAAATVVFYLLRKRLGDTGLAKEYMRNLLQLVGIADATNVNVHNAIESFMSDFKDALVAAITKRCELDYIVTRNTKDFVESPARAVTPQEFLAMV